MKSYIEQAIEQLCGKPPHEMTAPEREERIRALREQRSAGKLPSLEGQEPLKPRKLRKVPLKRPHAHKCEKCAAPQPCPIGPGCLEAPAYGLCPACGGAPLDAAKLRRVPQPCPAASVPAHEISLDTITSE